MGLQNSAKEFSTLTPEKNVTKNPTCPESERREIERSRIDDADRGRCRASLCKIHFNFKSKTGKSNIDLFQKPVDTKIVNSLSHDFKQTSFCDFANEVINGENY